MERSRQSAGDGFCGFEIGSKLTELFEGKVFQFLCQKVAKLRTFGDEGGAYSGSANVRHFLPEVQTFATF